MRLTIKAGLGFVVGRAIARLMCNLSRHYYVIYNTSPAAIDLPKLQNRVF